MGRGPNAKIDTYPRRVLCFAPQDEDLRILEGVLGRSGFKHQVFRAHSCDEARDVIEDLGEELDLVLLNMPSESPKGLGLLNWLRRETDFLGPVVVISDRESKDHMKQVYGAGATSYVVAPLSPPPANGPLALTAQYWLGTNRAPNWRPA